MADPLSWLQQMLGGEVPPSSADQAPSDTGPVALQYLQDVLSGKVAAGSPMLQNNYDPNASFAENVRNPAGIQQAMDVAMGVSGPGLAIRAYHGSPYDFERFDLSKIGTGEGAQAYGHGLYFAENPETAQIYRDQVKNVPLIDSVNARLSEIARERDKIRESGALIDKASPERQRFTDLATEYDRLMEEKLKPGRMYEAQINAEPEQFLDWDKPLGQQGTGVRQALGTAYPNMPDVPTASASWLAPKTPEEAQALREAGIPGIRYLDQGSRGAGQGTSNYVVFDDKLIEILRKYGILPPLAAGAGGAGLLGAGSEPPT